MPVNREAIVYGRRIVRSGVVFVIVLGGVSLSTVARSEAAAPAPGRFVAITAARFLDTRSGIGLGGAFSAGQTRTLVIGGRGAVPTNANAVVLNLTMISPKARGTVTVWPADQTARPSVVSIAVTAANQTRQNDVIVRVGTNRAVKVYTSVATHLLANVEGYWVPATTSTSGRFRGVEPLRVVDSRIAKPQGYPAVPSSGFAPGTRLGYALPYAAFNNKGISPIPQSGVSALVLSVTVVKARASGGTTVWAGDINHPPSPTNLYTAAGATATNLVTVAINRASDPATTRRFTYFNLLSGGHLLVDVLGYFTDTTAPAASEGLFNALIAPARSFDTRTGLGGRRAAIPANGAAAFTITGRTGVPGTRVRAVALNLTAYSTASAGSLTEFPATSPRPATVNATVTAADTRSATALGQVGTNGNITVFSTATTHVTGDVAGWFTAPPVQTTGKRLHLIYALPADVAYNASYDQAIRKDTEAAGDWLLSQNPGLRYRWLTDTLGFPVVTHVRLALNKTSLQGSTAVRTALLANGFINTDEVYAVYIESLGEGCGVTTNPAVAPVYSIDFMASCAIRPTAQSQGWPYGTSYLMLHETTHALGAVPTCAPHYNSYDPGHTGDDPRDVLWSVTSASDARQRDFAHLLLDPGHDDYFKHAANGCRDIATDPIWFHPG